MSRLIASIVTVVLAVAGLGFGAAAADAATADAVYVAPPRCAMARAAHAATWRPGTVTIAPAGCPQ